MLGIDAALDRVPAKRHGVVDHGAELLARGNQDLRLHQVNVGGHLGDGMLHLNARIHFDEGQAAVFVHQKFDGSGIHVADAAQGLYQDAANAFAQLGSDFHRGRFFHQLLMTALDAALALAQAHHIAVLVGQHLELDMARPLDEPLHVEIAIAERRRRLRLRRVKQVGQFLFAADDAHTASTAARRGFHDQAEIRRCAPTPALRPLRR